MTIEVRKGCFHYSPEKQILRDINFILPRGRILTVLGQNGIGKTTLLKCIIGIYKWSRGKTLINGSPMRFAKDINKIGYVPQARELIFPYTAGEIVAMGRVKNVSFFSVPSKSDRKKIDEALETVGIPHLKHRLCSQLSGGQLQLVFIARAIAKEPEVLILDEPESHLDYKNQFAVLKTLKTLVQERGISCIMNTHYPDHALRISDQTLLFGKNTHGENTYIEDETKKIITEKNIRNYFNVEAKILTVKRRDNTSVKSLVMTD